MKQSFTHKEGFTGTLEGEAHWGTWTDTSGTTQSPPLYYVHEQNGEKQSVKIGLWTAAMNIDNGELGDMVIEFQFSVPACVDVPDMAVLDDIEMRIFGIVVIPHIGMEAIDYDRLQFAAESIAAAFFNAETWRDAFLDSLSRNALRRLEHGNGVD